MIWFRGFAARRSALSTSCLEDEERQAKGLSGKGCESLFAFSGFRNRDEKSPAETDVSLFLFFLSSLDVSLGPPPRARVVSLAPATHRSNGRTRRLHHFHRSHSSSTRSTSFGSTSQRFGRHGFEEFVGSWSGRSW